MLCHWNDSFGCVCVHLQMRGMIWIWFLIWLAAKIFSQHYISSITNTHKAHHHTAHVCYTWLWWTIFQHGEQLGISMVLCFMCLVRVSVSEKCFSFVSNSHTIHLCVCVCVWLEYHPLPFYLFLSLSQPVPFSFIISCVGHRNSYCSYGRNHFANSRWFHVLLALNPLICLF